MRAPDPPPTDARAFWDAKILGWEESRYQSPRAAPTLIERIAGGVSTSLRFRREAALALLAPHVPGRRVVELGCGSGSLAGPVMALGAAAYHGIDLSPVAIARARERMAGLAHSEHMRFDAGAVADLPPQGDAVVFSLGLFDWLSDAEIAHAFAIARAGTYLHALSERRGSPAQLLHRLYVWLSYGWRGGGYVPRYQSLGEIQECLARQGLPPCRAYRHPRLRFGMFVSNLPLP